MATGVSARLGAVLAGCSSLSLVEDCPTRPGERRAGQSRDLMRLSLVWLCSSDYGTENADFFPAYRTSQGDLPWTST